MAILKNHWKRGGEERAKEAAQREGNVMGAGLTDFGSQEAPGHTKTQMKKTCRMSGSIESRSRLKVCTSTYL